MHEILHGVRRANNCKLRSTDRKRSLGSTRGHGADYSSEALAWINHVPKETFATARETRASQNFPLSARQPVGRLQPELPPWRQTSSRTSSRNVFSNQRRRSRKEPGLAASRNIGRCIANRLSSRKSFGRARRANSSGTCSGRRCWNGKRPSRNGSPAGN